MPYLELDDGPDKAGYINPNNNYSCWNFKIKGLTRPLHHYGQEVIEEVTYLMRDRHEKEKIIKEQEKLIADLENQLKMNNMDKEYLENLVKLQSKQLMV